MVRDSLQPTAVLDVQIGGAEANIAAACARLSLRAAWISALPAKAWGKRVRRYAAAGSRRRWTRPPPWPR